MFKVIASIEHVCDIEQLCALNKTPEKFTLDFLKNAMASYYNSLGWGELNPIHAQDIFFTINSVDVETGLLQNEGPLTCDPLFYTAPHNNPSEVMSYAYMRLQNPQTATYNITLISPLWITQLLDKLMTPKEIPTIYDLVSQDPYSKLPIKAFYGFRFNTLTNTLTPQEDILTIEHSKRVQKKLDNTSTKKARFEVIKTQYMATMQNKANDIETYRIDLLYLPLNTLTTLMGILTQANNDDENPFNFNAVTFLSLSYCPLEIFPDFIENFSSIKTLLLIQCELDNLNDIFDKKTFPNLTLLNVTSNWLEALPESIQQRIGSNFTCRHAGNLF